MPNAEILTELLEFYDRIQGTKTDFLEGTLFHNEHGDKSRRYVGRLEKYRQIDTQVIKDYFRHRENF